MIAQGTHPTVRMRAIAFARRAVIPIALGLLSWWALTPLDGPALVVPVLAALPEPQPEAPQALDLSAFRTPLWVAPPAPPPPPQAPPAPAARPPLRFQLVAIVDEGGSFKALLYDPDRDRMLSVSEGQTIAEATVVQAISGTTITIHDGHGPRALALRDERKGGTP